MSRLLLNTLLFACTVTLAGTASAEKPGTQKGAEVSGEHRGEAGEHRTASDQGEEQGKAYAGTKEKKDKPKKEKKKKEKKNKDK